jgi:hypothetical protein
MHCFPYPLANIREQTKTEAARRDDAGRANETAAPSRRSDFAASTLHSRFIAAPSF